LNPHCSADRMQNSIPKWGALRWGKVSAAHQMLGVPCYPSFSIIS
jgi:hypothetical protein